MVIITAYFLLITFSLIGFTSALATNKKNTFTIDAIAISPTLGITIITIVGTYLVNLQWPITLWANYLLFITFGISLISAIYFGSLYITNIVKQKLFYIYVSVLFIATIILLLPFVIRGLNFSLMRGNGTDQFNYIALAYYLLNYKLNFVAEHSYQFLINHDFTMGLLSGLINSRWSTSMILGWTSAITNINLFKIEYIYSIIFLLSLLGTSYAFIQGALKNHLYSLLVAVAITLGFWSQLVVDLNAMSQLSSISLLVLVGYLLVKIDSDKSELQIINRVVLGVVLGGIAYLYAESLPTIILGLIYYTILYNIKNKVTIKNLLLHGVTIGTFLLIILPNLMFLTNFLFDQLHIAVSLKADWSTTWFPWLYKNPLLGFWGLTYTLPVLTTPSFLLTNFFSILHVGFYILSVGLTIIAFIAFGKILIKKKIDPVFIMTFAMIAAGFTEFLYLAIHKQWWAAGKSLSYVYPFYYFVLTIALTPQEEKISRLIYIGKYFVLVWLVIQSSLGLYRIDYAKNYKFYPNYIGSSQYSYGYDWDIYTLTHYLDSHDIKSLGLFVSNPYEAQYLDVLLHKKHRLLNLYGSSYYAMSNYGMQNLTPVPDYFIVSKDQTFIKVDNCLAENNFLCLVKTPKDLYSQLKTNNFAILLMISSPYGQILSGNKQIYYIGTNPTNLQIYSYKQGKVTLNLNANLNTQGNTIKLLVSNDSSHVNNVSTKKEFVSIPNLPVKEGINNFYLSIKVNGKNANTQTSQNSNLNASNLYIEYQTKNGTNV